MQRLFSTFPNSWPGGGLLLLRIALALPAATDGLFTLLGVQNPWAVAAGLVSTLASALVLLGLWTPFAAAILCVAQLSTFFFGGFDLHMHLCRAAIAVSLGLLGPGAWSIDRLLFGRKRIDVRVKPPGGP